MRFYRMNITHRQLAPRGDSVGTSVMRRSAFTLLELLLVIVISTMLIGSVVLMTGTIGRDRTRLLAKDNQPDSSRIVQLMQRDFANSITIAQTPDARKLILTGHASYDPLTYVANDRLTQVTYYIANVGDNTMLFRSQKYLDDPVRSQPYTESVAMDVTAIQFAGLTSDYQPVDRNTNRTVVEEPATPVAPPMYYIPTRGKIYLQRANRMIEKEIWLR